MRLRVALLPLALLVARNSAADELSGTKSQQMFERADSIELRIDHGHATFVVRRTFENRSNHHDQAMLHVTNMPDGAVASGLRTLGGTAGNPIWYSADLLDAEVAAKKYKELTGIGGYYPKDPALLSWRSADHLLLQVFPVAPKSLKTVEYTLEAPTRWNAGHHEIVVPEMGLPGFAPTLTIKAVESGDRLFLDGIPIAAGDTRKLLGSLTLSAEPKDPPKLGGRFASIGFAKGRALVHTAVEVAPKLSQKPKDAYVIVLLDGSRSLSDGQRETELAATRAYLAQLPDAHVQLLVFDRVVHPLEASFVTVAQALDDLKKLKLSPKNGSDLDVALREAQQRIGDAPKGAPRRMLLLTDLATRSTLVPENIKGLEQSKAILHIAYVRGDSVVTGISRDDRDPWSVVPRTTGGLLWDTAVKTPLAAADVAEFEEWARPMRIDRLSITPLGATLEIDPPDSLAEGEGFAQLQLQTAGATSLKVKGELWSTPIETVLASTPAEEKLWAGLATATSLTVDLDDPEIAALAFKGGVVSSMTSYLAIEPGVRPSTEGLDWGQGFGGGGGRLSSARKTKAVKMVLADAEEDPRPKFLRDSIGKIVQACGGATVRTRLETTRTEIVSVDVVPKTPNPKLEGCVREGVFGLELPSTFYETWRSWDITVP